VNLYAAQNAHVLAPIEGGTGLTHVYAKEFASRHPRIAMLRVAAPSAANIPHARLSDTAVQAGFPLKA
jgi:hypothetical protein